MTHAEILMTEAHRLLDAWAASEQLYYTQPKPECEAAMRESLAAQYAASTIITVRATAVTSKYTTAVALLQEKANSEENQLVKRHLSEVLAKLAPRAEFAHAG